MTAPLFDGLDVQYLASMDCLKTGLALQAFVSPSQLLPVVRRLYEREYALEDITVIDGKEGFLAVWRFNILGKTTNRVALRMLASREDARFPSIFEVFQGAEWHERETSDFYGVTFEGNPNPIPLLLPDDMTEHPLLKEERQRQALAEIIPPGEAIRAEEGFAFFPKPDPEPEAEEAPAEV